MPAWKRMEGTARTPMQLRPKRYRDVSCHLQKGGRGKWKVSKGAGRGAGWKAPPKRRCNSARGPMKGINAPHRRRRVHTARRQPQGHRRLVSPPKRGSFRSPRGTHVIGRGNASRRGVGRAPIEDVTHQYKKRGVYRALGKLYRGTAGRGPTPRCRKRPHRGCSRMTASQYKRGGVVGAPEEVQHKNNGSGRGHAPRRGVGRAPIEDVVGRRRRREAGDGEHGSKEHGPEGGREHRPPGVEERAALRGEGGWGCQRASWG